MLLAQDYITQVLSSDPEDESLTQSFLIISVWSAVNNGSTRGPSSPAGPIWIIIA